MGTDSICSKTRDKGRRNDMYIERLIIRGYKILKDLDITLKEKMNIFIGENDSGKSSVLEAIQIATRGRLGRTYSTQCTTGNQNT